MRKLIHSKFQLDLSNFKISDTEENSWFSDTFFTKYTFPFEIDLTDDLNANLDFIDLYNTEPQLLYEVLYQHGNYISKAVFEVTQLQQKLNCEVRFGYETLPSFGKKLKELSLDKFVLPIGTTIYQHANTVVQSSWPTVNYNFPQIHTDKIDTSSGQWSSFEKIINNRKAGAFLINEVDDVNEITYNRNIMQPLPYWLHILQRAMIDDGYELAGGILLDERLQKATLFADVDYFYIVEFESLYVYQMKADAVEVSSVISTGNFVVNIGQYFIQSPLLYITNPIVAFRRYYHSKPLPNKGKYRVYGTFKMVRNQYLSSYFRVKYRNIEIFNYEFPKFLIQDYLSNVFRYSPMEFAIDFTFETSFDILPDELIFESYQSDTYVNDWTVMDITIDLVKLFDQSGNPLSTVINKNEVDLTRAVPDILVDDFIKVIKNWFNYDFTKVEGNKIYMDLVESNINTNDVVDFSEFDIKYPTRKFSQGNSFLLKYSDIDSKEYTFLPIFHNIDGVLSTGYKTTDKTTTIEVNALPLPLLTRDNVQTAHAFESNDSKVYLVPFDGLLNFNNYSLPIYDYLIPAVHATNWKKWFNFRINSVNFIWSFKCYVEKISSLTSKTKIRAYQNVHIINSINKTEIAPDLFEVEFDTQTLK